MNNKKEEIKKMLEACSNWDNQQEALKEAFYRGTEYKKKNTENLIYEFFSSNPGYKNWTGYRLPNSLIDFIVKETNK